VGVVAFVVAASAAEPKVTVSAAQVAAMDRILGGQDHGPLLTSGRAMVKANDDPATKAQTAWVFVFGPGGKFLPPGPGGQAVIQIKLQIVLVDDQSGEAIRSSVVSG
jgi:hypothetical protein